MLHDLLRVNWQVFEAVNQEAGHAGALDQLMVFGANDVVLVMPLLLLLLWFGLARWSPLRRQMASTETQDVKSEKSDQLRRLGQRMALAGCVAVGIALVLAIVLGNVLYEPRPFVSHPGIVHQLVSHPADPSFPSDHESVAGAVTTVLVLYLLIVLVRSIRSRAALRRWVAFLAVVAVVAALWIGVARVYVGIHYPGDILGGAGCGVIAGICATIVQRVLRPLLDGIIRLAEILRLA